MTNTKLLLGTAWTGAAAAAVGLGLLAVGLIDADSSTAATPAAATSSIAVTPAPDTAASTTAPAAAQVHQTAGGTVYASCDGGLPSVSAAPATGWGLDDSPAAGEVEFKQGDLRVEVLVTCGPSGPVFTDDDRSNGSVTSPAPASPSVTPAPATPAATTADDHGSGGHGADDTGADDSGDDSGSGGHGSDD